VVGASSLRQRWSAFESCLTWHLEAEERYVLPLVERTHAVEIQEARRAHARIRKLVSEVALELELNIAGECSTHELMSMLREHARRNMPALYTRADEVASSTVRYCVGAMLGLAMLDA